MPPRKKPNNETTTSSDTTPKVRKRTTKPKLKTPSVIKVKLPLQKAIEQQHVTRASKKSLQLVRKIELANEVAQLQLNKPSIVVSFKNDIKKEKPDEPTTPIKPSRKSKRTAQCLESSPELEVVKEEPTPPANQQPVNTPVARKPRSNRNSKVSKRKISIDRKNVVNNRKGPIDGKMKTLIRKMSIDGKGKAVKRKSSTDAKAKAVKRKPSSDVKTPASKQASNRKTAVTNPKAPDKNKTQKGSGEIQKTVNTEEVSVLVENVTEDLGNKPSVVVIEKSPKKAKSPNVSEKTPATRRKQPETTQPTKSPTKTSPKKKVDKNITTRVNNITRYLTVTKRANEGKENISKDDNIVHTPNTVQTRKTSVASSTNLSWTKDLSSSNTSISARSNDFVLIDNKLPILRLIKVDDIKQERIDKDDSSSDSSTSVSSESEKVSDDGIDVVDDLNLSTTSITSVDEGANVTDNPEKTDVRDELRKAFDKLSSSLKKFDVEIMKWIGHTNDDVETSFQNKILNVLKEENDVLDNCRRLKDYLKNANDVQENVPKNCDKEKRDDVAFVKPADVSRRTRDSTSDDAFLATERRDSTMNQNISTPKKSAHLNDDNVRTDNVRFSIDGQNYEDDDAISLYAESITGIESSRLNISNVSITKPASNEEEYIPRPVSENIPVDKFTYLPSKITEEHNEARKIVCEKQNADSTSVGKEFYEVLAETAMASFEEDYQESAKEFEDPTPEVPTCSVEKDSQLASKKPKFSVIFRNICFNNLQGTCKNVICRYPHIVPEIYEVKRKLSNLQDEHFIREYLFVRDWKSLRRKYGFCFVEECQNRKMSRLLVEMAVDFTTRATIGNDEDSMLQILVLEYVLVYLNDVNLAECEDLLLQKITPFVSLCDIFMVTIAMTQNFSRFKIVFLNLTRFMIEHHKSFSKKVSSQILERVCILPNEEPLMRAIIEMLKRTDASIFQSNMADQFERQLGVFDKGLHEEYLAAKVQALSRQPFLASKETDSLVVNVSRADDASPDTTNVDTMLKNLEPAITGPTDLNTPRFSQYSSPNSSVGEWPTYYQNWRRPAPRLMQPGFFRPSLRPHIRPPRRKVMFRPTSSKLRPSNYQRRARNF